MTSETVYIPVVRYRDADGNPTCAVNFKTGEVCAYFRTQRMGSEETCLFARYYLNGLTETMQRRDANGRLGSLVPFDYCPVWAEGL